MYLVLIQSATTALTGGRLRWQKLHRAGLVGARTEITAMDEESVAPVVDTWPPVRDQVPAARRPAIGRATARPVVPSQIPHPDHSWPVGGSERDEDMPTAGKLPGGGSGPVYTG
jgi:hypothetical protein